MSELTHKLANGRWKAVVKEGRNDTLEELKADLDRGYIHVQFTESRGGTVLGFRLDSEHADLSGGEFVAGTGRQHRQPWVRGPRRSTEEHPQVASELCYVN